MSTNLPQCANDTPVSGSSDVGELLHMSDAALADHINACAEAFLVAHRRYEQTGCFADAGERDRLYHAEASALIERGNRPYIVKAMEQERGLA